MTLLEKFEQQGNWLFKYRSYLPLVILMVGMFIYLYDQVYQVPVFFGETAYTEMYLWFCLTVSLFGLMIRIYTVGYTPSNTSGRNTKEQVADSVNKTGMYSMVRHPLYLGNFFMWLGPALLTGEFWFLISFCFFYWLYYERIMFAEEQFLQRKFGSVYTDWAKELPAFFPRFSNFRKADLPFSWKKVLKKEKNGLLAIFLIFSAFDICGKLVKSNTNFNYFLVAGVVLTLVSYVVLKYLKMKTQILDECGR